MYNMSRVVFISNTVLPLVIDSRAYSLIIVSHSVASTGSALAAASDIHRQVLAYIANIRHDWLTNQNTDCCFVLIGLVGRQSHSPLLQLKIDPVCQMCPPYWLASSGCQRIFISIRGQYGIQKNIFIHLWSQGLH